MQPQNASEFKVALIKEGSLAKPPATTSLKAGCVILSPRQSMAPHFTGEGDEALIILEGTATVFVGGSSKKVPAGFAAFIPPRTEHWVANNSSENVKYVYVAALK